MSKRRRPDHFTNRAKKSGYAARSVYKLEEIQRRFKLVKPGSRVLDLGAAPGSWTQYAAKVVGPHGRVIAVDLSPITATLPDWVQTVVGDITDAAMIEQLAAAGPFDAVICDAAPSTTGNRIVDTTRSAALVETAFAIADRVLAAGGAAVAKVFQGGAEADLVAGLRARYHSVSRVRPQATRKESFEAFVVAIGYTGHE